MYIFLYVLIGVDYIHKYLVFKIIFQILNKLADLIPRLIENIFEFWLGFLQSINVIKKDVNVAKTGVNLAVSLIINFTNK